MSTPKGFNTLELKNFKQNHRELDTVESNTLELTDFDDAPASGTSSDFSDNAPIAARQSNRFNPLSLQFWLGLVIPVVLAIGLIIGVVAILRTVFEPGAIDWSRMQPILATSGWETIYMVGLAVLIGGFFGLLIGLGLYLTRRGNLLENKLWFGILNVLINIVRPTPFIIFAMALGPVTRAIFGRIIGIQAFTFAMAVTAAFAFSRLVEQNLLSVDPGVVEAARAMGASPWRIIRTVLIPEALGPLILALTFLLVAVTDMSAIGNMLGAGGLGSVALTEGYRQFNWSIVYLVVLILVLGVQLFQYLGNHLARRFMRR